MKIKSFECPKSIKNYKAKILGTSNAWLMSRLSHRPSKPAYYIVDCRILELRFKNGERYFYLCYMQLPNFGKNVPHFEKVKTVPITSTQF